MYKFVYVEFNITFVPMIGEEIKNKRESLGISQNELARRCGLTANTICNIEKGKTTPSRLTLVHIKKVLK